MAGIKEFMVASDGDNERLDSFLAAQLEGLSRSACARLIEEGAVRINTTPATQKSERLVLGDRVSVLVPEAEKPEDLLVPNPDIELDIRYEDDDLIIISKQTGLVCHPSPGHVNDTLANALVAHCGYEHLGLLQGEDRPGIVHRLDQDTTGLMVCAKNDEVQKQLQDLIRMRVLDRRYVTLVHGYVAHDTGMIETGIARGGKDRLRMVVSDDPDAREAITTFRVLERFEAGVRDEGYSLLECHLYTGRTHQIRVHMAHIAHNVVGDALYGRGDLRRNLGLDRQFLHSWSIAFEHPRTGVELAYTDSLPDDLREALAGLADRSMGRTEAGESIVERLLAADGERA